MEQPNIKLENSRDNATLDKFALHKAVWKNDIEKVRDLLHSPDINPNEKYIDRRKFRRLVARIGLSWDHNYVSILFHSAFIPLVGFVFGTLTPITFGYGEIIRRHNEKITKIFTLLWGTGVYIAGVGSYLVRHLENSSYFSKMEINYTGWTALHIAAYNGYDELIREILRHPKLNFSETNLDGNTALHLATMGCRESTVRLLSSLTYYSIKNNNDETPRDIAKKNKNKTRYEDEKEEYRAIRKILKKEENFVLEAKVLEEKEKQLLKLTDENKIDIRLVFKNKFKLI